MTAANPKLVIFPDTVTPPSSELTGGDALTGKPAAMAGRGLPSFLRMISLFLLCAPQCLEHNQSPPWWGLGSCHRSLLKPLTVGLRTETTADFVSTSIPGLHGRNAIHLCHRKERRWEGGGNTQTIFNNSF